MPLLESKSTVLPPQKLVRRYVCITEVRNFNYECFNVHVQTSPRTPFSNTYNIRAIFSDGQPHRAKVWVWTQTSPSEICGAQCSTGTGPPPRELGFCPVRIIKIALHTIRNLINILQIKVEDMFQSHIEQLTKERFIYPKPQIFGQVEWTMTIFELIYRRFLSITEK